MPGTMFHHDDGIGALRKRRASHNLDGLSRTYVTRESFTGAHLANDA